MKDRVSCLQKPQSGILSQMHPLVVSSIAFTDSRSFCIQTYPTNLPCKAVILVWLPPKKSGKNRHLTGK